MRDNGVNRADTVASAGSQPPQRAPNLPEPGPVPTTYDLPTRGILFTILSTLLLTGNDVFAKLLSETWPVGQIMALRGSIVVIAVLIVMNLQGKLETLRIRNKKAMGVRAVSITLATFTFLSALSIMPIADALSITYVAPIMATGLAIVILGERVGWRRWAAMIAGLVGTIIALNPGGLLGGDAVSYPWTVALLPLMTAGFVAIRDVASRSLVSGDDSLAIMFYTVLAVMLAGYGTSIMGTWVWPTVMDWVMTMAAAAFMYGAFFFQIESFRFAQVNVIGPFRYVSLIFAALIGWLVWGDIPSWNMAVGAIVIVSSGLFIWWRELKKKASGP